ncbi:MAG: hypothetical protein ACRCX2_04775 [Paraclostridium sp.]
MNTVKCKICNNNMVGKTLKCSNNNCPSNHITAICPNCGSNDKYIKVMGLSITSYRCNRCSNLWNRNNVSK